MSGVTDDDDVVDDDMVPLVPCDECGVAVRFTELDLDTWRCASCMRAAMPMRRIPAPLDEPRPEDDTP